MYGLQLCRAWYHMSTFKFKEGWLRYKYRDAWTLYGAPLCTQAEQGPS